MVTKNDVIHDVWQMNFFVTLQICQNLSNFSYLMDEFYSHPAKEELSNEAGEQEEPRRLSA